MNTRWLTIVMMTAVATRAATNETPEGVTTRTSTSAVSRLPTVEVTGRADSLLGRHDQDIAYAYEYRVAPDAAPAFGEVVHPTEPIQFRAGLTARF